MGCCFFETGTSSWRFYKATRLTLPPAFILFLKRVLRTSYAESTTSPAPEADLLGHHPPILQMQPSGPPASFSVSPPAPLLLTQLITPPSTHTHSLTLKLSPKCLRSWNPVPRPRLLADPLPLLLPTRPDPPVTFRSIKSIAPALLKAPHPLLPLKVLASSFRPQL